MRGPRGHQHAAHQHPGDDHRRDHRFGHGGPPGRGRFGGGRTRRGDIRIALLSALTDGPGHGYQLIQRLEQRTGGRWRPSPGSVYPTLQLLEDAELVTASQQDDKRVFAITEAGQTELARLLAQAGPLPWSDDESAGSGGPGDLRRSIGQLVLAMKQVNMAGNPAHIEAATAILNDARRKLYQLLAEE